MESKLRDLLDKIYELEGLVNLSLMRDNLKDDFLRLISYKVKEVSDICENIKIVDSSDTDSEPSQTLDSGISDYVFDNEYALEEEISEESPSTAFQEDSSSAESRGHLVFSINDRFRFRKELFHNSDIDFNNTLVLVASMDNYDEAEDYFINEQGWDINNSEVSDFLNILKRYFR